MYSSIAALSVLSIAIGAVKAQVPANTQVLLKFEGGNVCLMNNGEENGGPVYTGLCPTARTPHDSNMYWNVVNGGFSADGKAPVTEIRVFGGTKCLDVVDGSTANGAQFQLWECTGGPNQKFRVNNFPDFTISWEGKNKCMDLPGGNTSPGVRVQTWDCDSSNPNQKWGFAFPPSVPQPAAPAGVAVGLVTSGIPRFPSCISAADNKNGAPVVIGECADTTPDNQRFTFTKGGALITLDGSIVLGPTTQIKVFGNMCLDLPSGNTAAGTVLQLWECAAEGTNPNQQWQFNSDKTITLAGNAALAIQLKDNDLRNGTPLIISQNGHLGSQLWATVAAK